MGLKILHSGDWHLDSPFASFREDRREALKRAQLQIPQKIAGICRKHGCDLVLLAGDLFDGTWSRDTLELVQQALADCSCPVMIAPGNHDPWGPDCPWLEKWPENVHIFPPEISDVILEDLDCRIYGAGFDSMDCRSLLKDFHADGEQRYQIGIFHGDPTNAHSAYNPVTTAQIRESGLQYLALGHVHTAGGLEVENTVCGWPGCPMGRGWDETGEKGCLLVKMGEQVEVETISMGLPGFYQMSVDMEQDAGKALEAVLPPAGNSDFYRITLTGYGKPNFPSLYWKFSGFPNLELRDKTMDPEELFSQAGEDSLRGTYFEKLKESAAEADPELRKQILLAAEISRKLLDGREVLLP